MLGPRGPQGTPILHQLRPLPSLGEGWATSSPGLRAALSRAHRPGRGLLQPYAACGGAMPLAPQGGTSLFLLPVRAFLHQRMGKGRRGRTGLVLWLLPYRSV